MKYLITYDLNKPGQDYRSLFDSIKSLGVWNHALQNTWFVDTPYNATQVRDTLKRVVDGSDKIFVTMIENWASYNMSEQANWLNNR